MMMSGNDFLKSQLLNCYVAISSDRVSQTRGLAAVNVRSPTVERLAEHQQMTGATRAERNVCRQAHRNEWSYVRRRTSGMAVCQLSLTQATKNKNTRIKQETETKTPMHSKSCPSPNSVNVVRQSICLVYNITGMPH